MPRVSPLARSSEVVPASAAVLVEAKEKPDLDVIGPLRGRIDETDPFVGTLGRGTGRRQSLGTVHGQAFELGASGRFLVGGRLAHPNPGRGADALAIYRAAKIEGGVFSTMKTSSVMRARVLGQLSEALRHAQSAPPGKLKQRAKCGALSLMIDLAAACPKSDAKLRRTIIDRLLVALSKEKDVEIVAFYLQSMKRLGLATHMDKLERSAFRTILGRVFHRRPLVEEWTEGRTKALEVRHQIHPEFWKDELKFFSKKNGFTLVKKNKKDTRRVYEGLLKDPTGKKPPLKVNLIVRKGELDSLEDMSDEKVHVICYSGHSALGGNGSQSINDGPEMVGPHPKLYFAANCRGKDNYAEFTNKYPEAHCIMTEHPTYSDSGQARIAALFDTLARGGTYRHMRKISEKKYWDEPADNYFYPDEWRKFSFMDLDEDGKIDFSPAGPDRVFDLDLREAGGKFVRAVNFANSELFYHWEVELEKGKKSFFGRKYGDSLVADGAIRDPEPGDVVRVRPLKAKGCSSTRYSVTFAPEVARSLDENLYAGLVTQNIVQALAREKAGGELTQREALRSVLMGAQAIHYLEVYSDVAPQTTKRFFELAGLTKNMDSKDVDAIFEAYDAHANAAQVKAFGTLLADKYGVDLDAWYTAHYG